ncbi:low molecular weight phosphotyrosine protein phosphatase [Sesbania bispinosa]|nr:low molecular weight phosphotyrosine protein phosphatase [Sesbania bispinosa]
MHHARSGSGKRDIVSRSSTSSARHPVSAIFFLWLDEDINLKDEAMGNDNGFAEGFKRLNAEAEELKRKNGKVSRKLTCRREEERKDVYSFAACELGCNSWVVSGFCI